MKTGPRSGRVRLSGDISSFVLASCLLAPPFSSIHFHVVIMTICSTRYPTQLLINLRIMHRTAFMQTRTMRMTNSIRCTIILYLHFLPPISQGYFFIDGGFYGVPFSLCKKGLFFPYSSLFSILPCHFYLFLQTIVPPQCVIFTSSNYL